MANAARPTTAPLSPKQRRALMSQRRRLKLDDATYYAAIASYPCITPAPEGATDWPDRGTPCRSSSHLSRSQCRHLITRWTIAGATVGGPYSGSRIDMRQRQANGIESLPTPAQRALIDLLKAEIQWRYADGYQRWLHTRMGQPQPNAPTTYSGAEAIIEGLRAMRDRHAA